MLRRKICGRGILEQKNIPPQESYIEYLGAFLSGENASDDESGRGERPFFIAVVEYVLTWKKGYDTLETSRKGIYIKGFTL